jgi:GDP-4-dehydro-6-deoxy-D-mannose reductase
MQTNVMGVANLLEACEELCQKVDVLLVGSAASFGDMCFSEESLSGDRECKPTSLYGRTRQMQLELGQLADESKQVNVFLCRTFNLIGPGLSERYVPAALLKRIAEAHQRGKKQIAVRDLNVVRDFIDTRDAVSAYFAILKNGRTKYPYSVGTGKGVTIRHLAETIVREFGIRLVITDDQLSSSNPRSEISRSIADPTRLTDDTGWKPEFSLEQSIRDMIRCNHTLPNV